MIIATSYQCRQALLLVLPLLAIAFAAMPMPKTMHHKFRLRGAALYLSDRLGDPLEASECTSTRLCSKDKIGLLVSYSR